MAGEFMSHPTAHATFLAFALFFARAVGRATLRDGALAGLALGALVNLRPWTALGLVVPFVVFSGVLLVRNPRRHAPALLATALVTLAGVAGFLAYNSATTGSPWVTGYEALHGEEHHPGFGRAAWGDPLTPERALETTRERTNFLNRYLFEWPFPSLLFVALLFAGRSWNLRDGLLLASFASLLIAYHFYWYTDDLLGPRFVFEAGGCLVLLTARGVTTLWERGGRLIGPALLVAFAFSIGISTPRLVRIYSEDYWSGQGKPVVREVRRRGLENAIVFVPGPEYRSAFSENEPAFDGPVVYARDLPGKERALREFPGREPYVWRGGELRSYSR